MSNYHVKINQCYPKCGLAIFVSVHLYGILKDRHATRTESTGQGAFRSVFPLFPNHCMDQAKSRTGQRAGCREQVR